MKKDDALDALDRAGNEIHDLNARVWSTALNPTDNGWGASLLSVAAIPVTNLASIGHLITSAVARQVSPSVYDKLPDLGGKKE